MWETWSSCVVLSSKVNSWTFKRLQPFLPVLQAASTELASWWRLGVKLGAQSCSDWSVLFEECPNSVLSGIMCCVCWRWFYVGHLTSAEVLHLQHLQLCWWCSLSTMSMCQVQRTEAQPCCSSSIHISTIIFDMMSWTTAFTVVGKMLNFSTLLSFIHFMFAALGLACRGMLAKSSTASPWWWNWQDTCDRAGPHIIYQCKGAVEIWNLFIKG